MIESLEPRRLMAADPGLPFDIGPQSLTLRRGTLYVVGAQTEQNLIAVYESPDEPARNVHVVYRFGDDAVEAAVADPMTPAGHEKFASRLVRRVVVVGGNRTDRVAVGSVPPSQPREQPPGSTEPPTMIPDDERAGNPKLYDDDDGNGKAVAFTDAGRLLPRTRVAVYGRAGDDVLIGGRARDDIFGGDGGDTLVGLALADDLHGEEGDDHLEGGRGADRLFGGGGADSINLFRGSQRQDRITGGAGKDVIDFARGVKLRDRDGDDVIEDRIA